MIASVRGSVLSVGLDHVVVEVGGVGMLVHTTPSGASSARTGQEATFFTTLVVREDSLTLFGFADDAERRLFELVQTVSGVGPRLALAMLAVHAPDALRAAIAGGDVPTLVKVPGIGRKGAERIVLELKDKVGALPGAATPVSEAPSAPAADVASQFASWESYFYPDTIDPLTGIGTLRNLYDERDARVLSRMEYTDTTVRAVQLGNGEVDIPRTFDGAHLRAIHGHLFQDVYEWAGEYRTVEMSKGPGRGFGEVKTGEVDRYLSDARQLVTSTDWAKISRNDFIATASTVFAYVNAGVANIFATELSSA